MQLQPERHRTNFKINHSLIVIVGHTYRKIYQRFLSTIEPCHSNCSAWLAKLYRYSSKLHNLIGSTIAWTRAEVAFKNLWSLKHNRQKNDTLIYFVWAIKVKEKMFFELQYNCAIRTKFFCNEFNSTVIGDGVNIFLWNSIGSQWKGRAPTTAESTSNSVISVIPPPNTPTC